MFLFEPDITYMISARKNTHASRNKKYVLSLRTYGSTKLRVLEREYGRTTRHDDEQIYIMLCGQSFLQVHLNIAYALHLN